MRLINLFVFVIFFLSANSYSKPKNVILLITDGMGVNAMSFGDLLWDIKEFKNFKHYGFVKPYPIESKYHITDSAAAGTAISCGEKTKVGTIAMDEKGKKLESVAYLAKKKGKSVGVVTNTRITHATPAVFYANNINRENEEEIARQISESDFDLFIGGGWKQVYSVLDNLKKNGYGVIREKKDMIGKYKKLIGIFSDSHISYELDRKQNEPSLSEIADFSLKFLNKNEKGFFLALESGRIDHCEHSNDAGCLAYEMKELKKVLAVIFDFVSKDKNTLFVMLSDHSNGGMSLGRDGNEVLNLDALKNIKASAENFLKETENIYDYEEFNKKYLGTFGLNISFKDFFEIKNKKIQVLEPLNFWVNVKWSTDQHEASFVPIFSYGPESEKFSGFIEIDEVGKKLKSIF